MLGIGLGGFVEGFARGYGLKQDREDREYRREVLEEERAWAREDRQFAAEDRAWQREQRSFERSERQRAIDQRDSIDAINADAAERFEAGVEKGKFDEDEFDKFWADYALPRMHRQMILNGDVDGARDLMEWTETRDAKEGRRLYGSALFKAQTGDPAGALDDLVKAGQLSGYIAGDYEISDKEEIRSDDGTLLGYRIGITDADGNTLEQDIALDDIPSVIATFANPEQAWNTQLSQRAGAAERENDIEDYRRKAEIDAEFSGDDGKRRRDAIEGLRERMAPDPLTNPDGVGFDDLPREEQERLIQEEMDLQSGQRSAQPPTPQTIVDTRTGLPIGGASGLGQVPTPQIEGPPASGRATGLSQGGGTGGRNRTPAPAPRGNAVINGQEDAGLPAPPTGRELVDQAARQMVEGGDPQEIARTLTAAGVPKGKWPAELTRVTNTR